MTQMGGQNFLGTFSHRLRVGPEIIDDRPSQTDRPLPVKNDNSLIPTEGSTYPDMLACSAIELHCKPWFHS